MLTQEKVEWLDRYHATVSANVSPQLDAEELSWLERVTRPLGWIRNIGRPLSVGR